MSRQVLRAFELRAAYRTPEGLGDLVHSEVVLDVTGLAKNLPTIVDFAPVVFAVLALGVEFVEELVKALVYAFHSLWDAVIR